MSHMQKTYIISALFPFSLALLFIALYQKVVIEHLNSKLKSDDLLPVIENHALLDTNEKGLTDFHEHFSLVTDRKSINCGE